MIFSLQLFENTALKHGKVNLTWDETDPNRAAAMKKAFDAASDDEGDDDVRAYLANSSDDEEPEGIALAPFGDDEELGTVLLGTFLHLASNFEKICYVVVYLCCSTETCYTLLNTPHSKI